MSEHNSSSDDVLDAESLARIENLAKIHQTVYNKDLDTFQLLSTIRYDPQLTTVPPVSIDELSKDNFFLLHDHVERLRFTVKFFTNYYTKGNSATTKQQLKVSDSIIFEQLKDAIDKSQLPLFNPLKIRLLVSLGTDSTNSNVDIELYSVPPIADLYSGLFDETSHPEEIWDLYVDSESTLASPFTSFKTTSRQCYTEARNRCLPGLRPGKEEVVLTNTAGEVMEGSITNIALKTKNDVWVTPQLTSGCLCGVMRSHLLQKNKIQEYTIYKADLKAGTQVLIFNAIMGVKRARIVG